VNVLGAVVRSRMAPLALPFHLKIRHDARRSVSRRSVGTATDKRAVASKDAQKEPRKYRAPSKKKIAVESPRARETGTRVRMLLMRQDPDCTVQFFIKKMCLTHVVFF
jgi:hypothetical protein